MYKNVKYVPSGDNCLLMEFGNSITPEINGKIRSMIGKLEDLDSDYIREVLPTYRSISVFYDPQKIKFSKLVENLKEIEEDLGETDSGEFRVIELPTVYGGEYGPDIEYVASHNGISVDEVIKLHTSVDYLVYMLGFTPGFSYLGGLDERIHTPRLENPRVKIPAGSTGIAGSQTGIYPIDSPGGWQLIGRTPVKLYNPLDEPPVLLRAGDYVRFVQISEKEYLDLEEQIKNDEYEVKIILGGEKDE